MTRAERLYEVLRHIRPVHQYSAHAVTDALRDRNVTMPMRAVLERLRDAGPQTVPQIGRSLWITRQGIQAIVDEARHLGYVETRPNPQHRRSHLVALTDSGRAAFDALHAAELTRLDAIAARLDPADIEACVRVLARLTDGLRAMVDPATSDSGPTPTTNLAGGDTR
ncbi:MarR family winged helix-turn-helix transcriptional regulator [Piscicoccus intestinalis]|uniref:MarR family winged helix-turn-helix transcriptional regulator n=1 Tax=Piscicoccus intestinalis TaxID=746033 RepID=UPI0012ECE66A|nr:MarR family winged helix-turn-helix transcriptional regulator [Piscicoccus intestinalis]